MSYFLLYLQNGQENHLLFKRHQRQPDLGAVIIGAKKEAVGLLHIARYSMLKYGNRQEAISSVSNSHNNFADESTATLTGRLIST